ncbi:hypothetical protein BV25DRAFT_1789644, partial [Artomyces pyxidatus]
MTYLGVAPGGHGDRFMRSPNNVVFTSAHALFDENMFPKCAKEMKRRTTWLPNSAPDSNDEPDVPHPLDDDDDFPSSSPPNPSKRDPPPSNDNSGSQNPPQPPQGEPRRSERQRNLPRPSYKEQDLRRRPEPGPSRSRPAPTQQEQVPGPSSEPSVPHPSDNAQNPLSDDEHLAKLCREGGAPLINYLLAHAVGDDEGPHNVKEWTYRDILRLPKAEQEE